VAEVKVQGNSSLGVSQRRSAPLPECRSCTYLTNSSLSLLGEAVSTTTTSLALYLPYAAFRPCLRSTFPSLGILVLSTLPAP
jgi:hypothetical protein